jgi:hypothetical protein
MFEAEALSVLNAIWTCCYLIPATYLAGGPRVNPHNVAQISARAAM